MRKQLLGATAVLLGATTLGVGFPTAATHADAWKAPTSVPFPAGTVTDVDVVSTGDGDAVAAAIIDGAVHASTAVDGVWAPSHQVRGDVDATRLVLASNGNGKAAVGWVENVGGDDRLRVSRQVSATSWTGLKLVTPAGSDVSGAPQLGMAGDGLVIAAAAVDGGESDHELFVTEWPQGGVPGAPDSISSSDSWNPALDVNSKGEALLAYNYTGLIDDTMTVARRTPGQGWNLGKPTFNSGDIASSPDVAISENGKGQVVYTVVTNDGYWPEASPVKADGTALTAHLVSQPEALTSAWEPNVDINSAGTALFTYRTVKEGVTKVQYAVAADGAYAANPQVLTGSLADAESPIARIGDTGLRLIHHSGSGMLATHFKSSQVQPFAPLVSEPGYLLDTDADIDAGGNAVTVGIKPGNGVRARFLDAGGPDLALTKPGTPVTYATTIPLAWSMSDGLSPLSPGTDIYATSAAWNQTKHGAPKVVINNAVGTSAAFPAVPGSSYCFQAQVSDTASNSTTTPKRCTTVPLDDTSLTGKKWKHKSKAGHFNNTVVQTKRKGASLKLTGIAAQQISLIADRLAKGGKVKIKWNGKVVRKLSLKGTKANSLTLPVVSFGSVQTGTLKIKVVGKDRRPVRIDGLVVAK